MALRRPNRGSLKEEYPPSFSNYNVTSDGNPSHLVNETGNEFLRPITLENIDEAVFTEFNRRFTIAGRQVNLILLDADVAAMQYEQFENFDKTKQYINFPYFTMWRSDVSPLFRTSPSNKPIIYAIPTNKPQGVVYTEYIMPPPQMLKFTYNFQFLTTFREYTNHFEEQMLKYFQNKRNVLLLDNERFEIMPAESTTLGSLEITDREGASGQSVYVLKFDLIVIGYLRKLEDIQKRERPNTYTIQIKEHSKAESEEITRFETRLPKQKTDNVDNPEPF
jgi:hypothetical protein